MSPRDRAQEQGRIWEEHAAEYLAARGMSILVRGYRCRLGELDIVGTDGTGLVVVEVRARAGTSRHRAIETVGPLKRRRIVNATRHFLMKHPAWYSQPIRFDVLAIDGIDRRDPDYSWVRNAFEAT
jgi:putative endonuclease